MGFSRQKHWSGLPFPPPMHESEKSKWSRSVVSDFLETPWTAAYQAPPSMGFSRQEYWSGVPLLSPDGSPSALFYLSLSLLLCPSQQRGTGAPGGSDGKESACSAGDQGSIPGSGRSPGEGNSNPFQYSCLENPMDGGAWRATVREVTKSRTWPSNFTVIVNKGATEA